MPSITKDQMEILIDLQRIETESNRIQLLLDKVNDKLDTLDLKLNDFEENVIEKESDVNELKKQYKDFEIEVQDKNERLLKSEEYLKTVTTNKEYQVLLREIDENKKKNSDIEDEMIELLDSIENEDKDLKIIQNDFDQLKIQIESEKEKILDESVEERQELELMTKKRDEIAENVKSDILSRFNRILSQSKSLALVPVKNAICKGCYNKIPPQLFNELQSGEILHFCPQCHRMIYWDSNGDES